MQKAFAFLFVLLAIVLPTSAAESEPKLGLQTWTCRHMTYEQVVDFATKHHIKYIQFITKQFDVNTPPEEIKKKKAELGAKGLVAYTFGVVRPTTSKEENRKFFEFAKLLGAKLIVVEPQDQRAWDSLEELVKEYDIKLAIHNHGIDTVYGKPETVKKILAARDPRIGVCLDVGHLTGAGFDAAKTFREYNGRVYDIHFKDKRKIAAGTSQEKKKEADVFIGTGDTDYQALFAELKKEKWDGVMAIETDNDQFAKDPGAFVDAAAKFLHDNMP